MTGVYEIDPLEDGRWASLLARHASATIFHSRAWLDALRRTYGYEIAAVTTSAPGDELTNALVFCRVRSWLMGKRIVSVPFSDHCTPLISGEDQLGDLLSRLQGECDKSRQKYIEIRAVERGILAPRAFSESASFCWHRLDLRPNLDELNRGLHTDCIRRKIKRAERERFEYRSGRSEELLRDFYHLALVTRKRHNLPPQPLNWFRNLIDCLGEQVNLRLLFYSGQPAAAVLTTVFRNTVTYKYGFSEKRFHKSGVMQLLIWKAIQEAKQGGALEFDMGRSDWTNHGLIVFKDRWGCRRSAITYLRYPQKPIEVSSLKLRVARQIFGIAPAGFLRMAGNLLYRHMA